MIKNADEMLGALSNLNIDAGIRAFSQDVFYPAMREKVQEDGYILFPYTVGAPVENDRLRFSTNDIDDGRQSLGIYNTLSFILEGKGYGDMANELERRSAAQLSAMTAFLHTAAAKSGEILGMVRPARAALLEEVAPGERAFVRMDYFPRPRPAQHRLPGIRPGEVAGRGPRLEALRTAGQGQEKRPLAAGLCHPGRGNRADRTAQAPPAAPVAADGPGRGACWKNTAILHVAARIEEERSMPEFDLEKISEKTELAAGDVVVFLSQPARLLDPPAARTRILLGHPDRHRRSPQPVQRLRPGRRHLPDHAPDGKDRLAAGRDQVDQNRWFSVDGNTVIRQTAR